MRKKIVKSIGIIVDGNRRGAVENNLKRTDGHQEGLERILDFIDWGKNMNIKNMTFYIFSQENGNRSPIEVEILMRLFKKVFDNEVEKILSKDVAIKFIGSIERMSKSLKQAMVDIEEKTKEHKTKVFLAISYGGRDEIIQAVKKIINDKKNNEILKIKEKEFEKYLQSSEIPEPEIIIRTGGHRRLSNFLLGKASYSELFFIRKNGPDFNKYDLIDIIDEYKNNTTINKGV